MRGYTLLMLISLSSLFWSCNTVNPNYQQETADPAYFQDAMQQLTDVIVHDIFSPPVASRIYAYPSLAAYEVMVNDTSNNYQSLAGQLNKFEAIPQPAADQEYCFPVASLNAFLIVGKALIFSENMIDTFSARLMEDLQKIGVPKAVFQRSLEYGEAVAAHILAYADTDNYKETRTYPKFTFNNDPTRWQPTPPDYMDGIEPHWRSIRPFVLDSSTQFVPPPPTPFDLEEGSPFYKEVMEVYTALDAPDREERIAIAEFWDCNPYVSHHTGHVMYATKKITPGGHWIGIVKIAAKKADADFIKTIEAYTLTSIALADAFISCWDEKYRSNLVRPETVINKNFDEEWRPALQTPPFPEYTSGHSVISRSAATALTSIFGDNFAFDDTTEEAYGLPVRSYKSFFHASEEAAVSRLYGGIHYGPAIYNGVAQGEEVGKFIVDQIQMTK
ncbi:MAG: vanadium-dependent haloperoxidase [Bacteroidota bacterium]